MNDIIGEVIAEDRERRKPKSLKSGAVVALGFQAKRKEDELQRLRDSLKVAVDAGKALGELTASVLVERVEMQKRIVAGEALISAVINTGEMHAHEELEGELCAFVSRI